MKPIVRTLSPLALAALISLHSSAHAQTKTAKPATKASSAKATKAKPTVARTDASAVAAMKAARQLMKDSATAYKSLNSYSSDVTWNNGTAQPLRGKVAWQRPNMLMAEVKMGPQTYQKYVSDRKVIETKVVGDATRYTSAPAGEATSVLAEAMSEIGQVGLSLGTFLTDADPLAAYGDSIKTLNSHVATAEEATGLDLKPTELKVVNIGLEIKQGPNTLPVAMSYVLGAKDKLVRRFSVNYKVGARAISQIESYTNVKVNPKIEATALKFTPAATAQLVDDLNPTYDERLRTGAVPIELKATDLKGAPISFNDYKGKVVLVDFWATWCPPCRAEMPNVIANYNKYHDQGFDIVGISLDEDKGALDKYIADNKMPWRQVFDGKGWESEAGKTFGVRAIPFAMIIGRDGKIAALNARGEALEAAITKALAEPAPAQ